MSQLQSIPDRTSLFRPEVIVEQETQSLGTVLLAPSIPVRLTALFALLAAASLLTLLFFGEYTRTSRINGWLVPQQGLLRVFAPQTGVVVQVHVREGAEVKKGQPLVELSSELQSGANLGTQEEVARQLTLRRQSLIENGGAQKRLFTERRKDLFERITALQSARGSLVSEMALQTERSTLAREFAARQAELLRRGFITNEAVQDAEQNRLAQASQLLALERERDNIERELTTVRGELRDLPLTEKAKLAEIDREIAGLDQESALTEARRGIVISAPQDGTVSTLQVEVGGNVETTAPLLSMIPAGSKLEAHLFSPSRAIGFVRPGQRVLLRYQAFPYQKFGQYEGVVAGVSRSALSPGDLSQQLPGLSSLYGANEPVYRITVDLKSQAANAYGGTVALQPGMQLEASVVMETRTLIEWVFEPLFTLTGALP